MTHRFQHATHFTVAAFGDGDPVPAIGPFATAVFDGAERCHAVVQAHTVKQLLFFLITQSTQHPNGVLTLQPEAGVHQLVGQLPRAGKQQETFGIQIQTPNRLPLALHEPGQFAKHGGSVLRIVMGHDFAHRLVVSDHTRWGWVDAIADRLAVDLDLITKLDALTDVSGLVIDRNPPLQNQLFHFKARTQTRLGQHLV